ncbi:PDR/VanB family oxidoreductase [Bradyrhizobium sp. NP1]|uniref:PDR/VanB family oxidoreductase n=1 Tax=Bradyrhizobium sp. NP1 TaxID=3049772 RepID=UPI0025A54681|nr:PDR/VanB family oxidoreductase [Bradyrhizobium sp. NP1]WJR76858.1 PDR/VanB family oxidoreductase [Bradyrhizobium sp. NP1]
MHGVYSAGRAESYSAAVRHNTPPMGANPGGEPTQEAALPQQLMLDLRVKSTTWEAPNIISYELRSTDGSSLPEFTAGAHIDLKLPTGVMRSYSLLNPQGERDRYIIAVQKDRMSRGGSKWIHQNLRAGEVLSTSGPRNNFRLLEEADKSVLIAGGIGITPMLSMVERLKFLKKDWELFFCARTRNSTPFVEKLQSDARVRFNFDRERGGSMLDMATLISSYDLHTHFYCCGPLSMLEAFETATAHLPREQVHVEYFTAAEPPATAGGFKVVLAKSGREIDVPPGKTILDALNDAGIVTPYSCAEGVCGTCETFVLEGIPDHRDRILTEAEKTSNKKMMICCSGSKSERLVLNL